MIAEHRLGKPAASRALMTVNTIRNELHQVGYGKEDVLDKKASEGSEGSKGSRSDRSKWSLADLLEQQTTRKRHS